MALYVHTARYCGQHHLPDALWTKHTHFLWMLPWQHIFLHLTVFPTPSWRACQVPHWEQITVPNQTRRGLMCWSKFRFNVTTWLILHQRSVAARPYLCKCVSFVSKLSHPLSFLISDVEMADKRVLFFSPSKCCYVTLFHQATLKTKKKRYIINVVLCTTSAKYDTYK